MSVLVKTPQEGYEKIRAWFSRERAVFGHNGAVCMYRGGQFPTSEFRCAIGCLIPDEKYDPKWDGPRGGGLKTVLNTWPETENLWGPGVVEYLVSAQNCHDSHAMASGTVQEFIAALDAEAADWGLEVIS